jgi:NADH:ubiquinone oxidoreductase subunit 6 (subunit J)
MDNGAFAALGAAFLGILCVAVLIVLVIAIFYLLTLQRALSRVAPRNRMMEPGMVWLSLIPCLNLIWGFFIAIQVPGSLKNEFRDRGQDDGSDYGKSIGLGNCILGLVNIFISNGLGRIPEFAVAASIISGVVGIISLVLFIIFWVKIANYSAQLVSDDRGDVQRKLEKFDDDDDDDEGFNAPQGKSPSASPDTYKEGDPGRFQ